MKRQAWRRPMTAVAFVAVSLLLCQARAAAPGFGGWSFGMTPEQVKAVKACSPYKEVKTTGGLECPGFRFAGAKMNISFVFAAGKLAKIQLWFYEGTEEKKAARQLKLLLAQLKKTYGAVESPTIKDPGTLDESLLLAEVKKLKGSGTAPAKVQFKPAKNPAEHFTFASLIFNPPRALYVFLYFQPPR